MSGMPELLPCKDCGACAVSFNPWAFQHHCKCSKCGVSTRTYGHEAGAVNAWNAHNGPAPEDPALSALRAELEALKDDIARFVKIASDEATEAAALRAEGKLLEEQLEDARRQHNETCHELAADRDALRAELEEARGFVDMVARLPCDPDDGDELEAAEHITAGDVRRARALSRPHATTDGDG